MALIIITIVVMFLVLIFWSFTNLGKTNITKKYTKQIDRKIQGGVKL